MNLFCVWACLLDIWTSVGFIVRLYVWLYVGASIDVGFADPGRIIVELTERRWALEEGDDDHVPYRQPVNVNVKLTSGRRCHFTWRECLSHASLRLQMMAFFAAVLAL